LFHGSAAAPSVPEIDQPFNHEEGQIEGDLYQVG
jgi:hypothetical protein